MELFEYAKKVLRTEDGENIYIDLRPFGAKESEAILFCLQETFAAVCNEGATKKIVLICEPTTEIPSSVPQLIRQFQTVHQTVEIRSQHRETSE